MIEPKNYWEERTELCEELLHRVMAVIASNIPATRYTLEGLMATWKDLVTKLDEKV